MMLANVIGIMLIALVVWWFWWPRSRRETTVADGAIEVVVADGVVISLKNAYRSDRMDAAQCYAWTSGISHRSRKIPHSRSNCYMGI